MGCRVLFSIAPRVSHKLFSHSHPRHACPALRRENSTTRAACTAADRAVRLSGQMRSGRALSASCTDHNGKAYKPTETRCSYLFACAFVYGRPVIVLGRCIFTALSFWLSFFACVHESELKLCFFFFKFCPRMCDEDNNAMRKYATRERRTKIARQ